MRLKNKVAIITGGSQGVGAALAMRFAEEGAEVAIVNRSPNDAVNSVLGAIEADGGTARAFHADISLPGQSRQLVDGVAATMGGVDILINNAGVFLPTPVNDTTEDVWDRMLDTNLKGPFFCTQAAVPHMRRRGGGAIINIGSIFGVDGFPGSAAYCAAKGGVELLTKAIGLELRDDGINVNCLAPGCVKTPMNQDLRDEGGDFTRLLKERFNGDPWLEPEDMAGAAVFLASDDAKAITGATLMVDAGWSAY